MAASKHARTPPWRIRAALAQRSALRMRRATRMTRRVRAAHQQQTSRFSLRAGIARLRLRNIAAPSARSSRRGDINKRASTCALARPLARAARIIGARGYLTRIMRAMRAYR